MVVKRSARYDTSSYACETCSYAGGSERERERADKPSFHENGIFLFSGVRERERGSERRGSFFCS